MTICHCEEHSNEAIPWTTDRGRQTAVGQELSIWPADGVCLTIAMLVMSLPMSLRLRSLQQIGAGFSCYDFLFKSFALPYEQGPQQKKGKVGDEMEKDAEK